VVAQGAVRWVGARSALPAEFAGPWRMHDGGGALVTPGLVDCHTHLVYGGQRANEFAMRLAGATYEEVAKAGGGIVSSVRATREADEDTLFAQAAARLEQLLADGVCAIEIKSGYGLSLEHERKQLRVARRLGEAYGVTVRTTFLGAHALPPEYAGRSGDYIDLVCREMLPALAAEGLVDAVDVFCERIAFSLAETEQVFQAAKALGLPVKLHAEQLSDMGGAALAARYGALSCDHIEHLSADGIEAMRQCGHRGRAAARRLLHAARHAPAAHRRAARRRRADGGVHRPQPRHLAGAEPAADGEHGLHAVSPDRARGARRRHRARRARARPARHARRHRARHARQLRAVERARSGRAGLLVRPATRAHRGAPGPHRHRSPAMTNTLFAADALLPQGWSKNVLLAWNDAGQLTQVQADAQRPPSTRHRSAAR
jgi:imidazolonepropionase-like amidohydrolase